MGNRASIIQELRSETAGFQLINDPNKKIKWHSKNIDKQGNTLLLCAINFRYKNLAVAIIERYVEYEKNPPKNKKMKPGRYLNLLFHPNVFTPIEHACMNNMDEVVNELLKYNCDKITSSNPYESKNLIEYFLEFRRNFSDSYFEIFNKILDRNPEYSYIPFKKGNNILTYYVNFTKCLHYAIFIKIIDSGADVNFQYIENGRTFLMELLATNNNISKYIIEYPKFHEKYDWMIVDINKKNTLHYAAMYGDVEIFKLIARKYDIKKFYISCIEESLSEKNINVASFLLLFGIDDIESAINDFETKIVESSVSLIVSNREKIKSSSGHYLKILNELIQELEQKESPNLLYR